MRYMVPAARLAETFEIFRRCGAGHRECQVLWTSEWSRPEIICDVIHPNHRAHREGFEVESAWVNALWLELARRGRGVRVQVHTHPREAFHSRVDDAYPIIHSAGFLSLVIPNFALGPVGLVGAYLAEIREDGRWTAVTPHERLEIAP